MASWVYDEKFPMGTQFVFRTLLFTAGQDDDLEHPTQEQEERRTTTIDFEFSWGFGNSAVTLQRSEIDQLLEQVPDDRQIDDVQYGSSLSSSTQAQPEFQHGSAAHPHRVDAAFGPEETSFALPVQQGAKLTRHIGIPDPESVCALQRRQYEWHPLV
jgi:hypothetical protein